MHLKILQKRCSLLFIALLLAVSPVVSWAQRSADDNLRSRTMERLDEAKAAEMIRLFRLQHPAENFCFQFQLEHKPRRGRTVRYEGILFGSRNRFGPVTRVKLFREKLGEASPVGLSPIEIIVQNGLAPRVWVRNQVADDFVLIEDARLFEPIFEGVLYTPFDLQMPFVFWNDYTYEGPSRVLSRIGQKFRLLPPEGSLAFRNDVEAVRVSIDDTYYALLRAEVLGTDDKVRSQFTVRGIKKVDEHYIVKEVELKNVATKDATSFKVKAARLGLLLDRDLFNPDEPIELPEIPATSFEIL